MGGHVTGSVLVVDTAVVVVVSEVKDVAGVVLIVVDIVVVG